MSFSISRLRHGFAALALVAVAVVAGFYLYARWEMRRALRNLPEKLGVNIQQSSQGFTLSKSEGGHTLFTVHASRATQFKQGGRAELHDVRIAVYGRHSDRFDQIYGSDFEYDPLQAAVSSQGVVEIDLGGVQQKGVPSAAPGQSPPLPKEGGGGAPGSPASNEVPLHLPPGALHLRAEGLVFYEKTGVAESRGLVEFRLPQAQGTARGVSYDSKRNELTLNSAIDLRTEGGAPEHIVARHAAITKVPRELTLDGAEITGAGRMLAADRAVAHLAADNALQRVEAAGNVRVSDAGGLRLRAPKGEMLFGPGGTVESAWFGGGVEFESGAQSAEGHAGQMRLLFAASEPGKKGSVEAAGLERIFADQGVVMRQAARPESRNPQTMTMTSSAMSLALKPASSGSAKGGQAQLSHLSRKGGGEGGAPTTILRSAQTEGPGELIIASAAESGEQTVIDAQHFTADFGEQGRLRTLHGEGGVRVTSRSPGQPEKVSTSETLEAEFSPSGEISHAVQEGDFRYREAQGSKNEPGGRTVTAARATYSPADDSLLLTGEPRIVDGGMTVEADSIRLLRRTGEAFASGHVKTTYSQLKVEPGGALLAAGEPVHVTAQAMNAQQASGLAHYTGGARLWQGSNVVEAQTIEFNERARTIAATGDERHPVTSVFLQAGGKGKAAAMVVTAPRLSYEDNARQAHYSGGVTAKGEDGVMTAGRVDIFLSPAGRGEAGQSGAALTLMAPSQLERIVASSHVVLRQKARRAEGDKLVYDAAKGSYVMTGGPPTLSDPVNGTVRGDSLTFYSRDDRVVVEGGDNSRAVTRTRVSR